MRARTISFALSLLATSMPSMSAYADNWGHWRGVDGNGVALNVDPPTEFGPSKNLKWRFPIPGRGSGSPVVWDNQVFAVTAAPIAGQGDKLSFRVYCIDRQTGKALWEKTAIEAVPHDPTHSTNTFASASPCTDGKHVYAHFGSQGLFCYTMKGELVWSKQFGKMRIRNNFGEGSSPTVVDDMIIVPWDHESGSKLFALNKLTGETVWEISRDEPTCWATPHIATDSTGRKQIVMNGQTAARGYDLKTGEELWKCGGQTQRPCASAVSKDGVTFVTSGFRGSFIGAFDMAGKGDLQGTKFVKWSANKNTPDVASPALSGNRLYYYKEKTGLLTCVDIATGKEIYAAARIPGINSTYASPVVANGFIYLTDRQGKITVIKDGDTVEVVATNQLDEGVDATPAFVDKEIFIRSDSALYCFSK